MTVQVDFYILQSIDEQSRLQTVCRLADKIHRLGLRIHILTSDIDQSNKLNDLLWTFSPSSFVPHALLNLSDEFLDQQPVLISHQTFSLHGDVLINLQEHHHTADHYQRLVEIINQDDSIRTAGRDKYRAYKTSNYTIKTHQLAA